MLLVPINPVHILIPFYFSELPSQSQIKSNFFLSFIQKLASMLQLTKKWSDYWASFFQSVLRSTAGQKLQKWTLFKNLPHTTKFFLFFFFGQAAQLCDLSSLIRNQTGPSAVKVWSPSHWVTGNFKLLLLRIIRLKSSVINTHITVCHYSNSMILWPKQ